MRKLTKQNLDELAKTMQLVPEQEQRGYMGMYSNDCFWQCVAHIMGGDGSSAQAEVYANSFYERFLEMRRASYPGNDYEYFQQFGAGVSDDEIKSFVASCSELRNILDTGGGEYGGIGFATFDMSVAISWYEGSNIIFESGGVPRHSVVILSEDAWEYTLMDPDNGIPFTVPKSEFNKANGIATS